MILQRIYCPGEKKRDELHALTVEMLQMALADWTPAYLTLLVKADNVPKSYIDSVVTHVLKHPKLIALEKDQFLVAAKVVRPDLYPIIVTPEGDKWLEHVMAELGKSLLLRPIQWLVGGG